jgi:hypothetical protein
MELPAVSRVMKLTGDNHLLRVAEQQQDEMHT